MTNAPLEEIYIRPLTLYNALAITLSDDEAVGILPSVKNIRSIIKKIKACISAHQTHDIGQLIMKTEIVRGADNQSHYLTTYMQQVNGFINDVDSPFKMHEKIIIENCLYTGFIGQNSNLLSRFLEMQSLAKKQGLSMTNEIYMLFNTDDNGEDIIAADIFIPVE